MPNGFQETQATFRGPSGKELVGQVRRLGPAGPAYQVMDVAENGDVEVEVITSGERASFPISEVLEDPVAEIIP